MDSKQINSHAYYAKLIELYKLQLKNRRYDLIIPIDTFAYDFILTYYHELFTDEPILFSGPERYDRQRIFDLGLEDRVYGLIEKRAISDNFALIKKMLPNLKKLTIINDNSGNGNDTHPLLQEMIEQYRQKIEISYIRKSTISELKKLFKTPKKDEAVLFVRFYNEESGKLNKNSQIASMIDSFKIPVFVTDTLFYGSGAVGGKLVNVNGLGGKTGRMALKVLNHDVSPLHVEVFDEYIYGFDYEKLDSFHLHPEIFLQNFQVTNKPLSFFDKYRTLVNDMFLIYPFLIFLILVLIYNIYKRVQGERKLRIAQEQKDKHRQFVIQQSKLAEIGEIFSSIAHQWKNPLVEISAIAQEHLYAVDKPQDKSYVDDIMVQVKYMSDTIGDFQKFIVPSNKKTLFDIQECIDTIMKILDHTIKYNYIDIVIDSSKVENFMVHGYKNEFMQTLLNIFNNAKDQIKIAREQKQIKRGKIEIKLYNMGENICIEINDNGGGFDKRYKERIFEPYFTTKEQGHGIGLYMSRLIIEDKMDGKISAKNCGAGACFSIYLKSVK